jgi:F0F1-type ATP synthase assembly protein I
LLLTAIASVALLAKAMLVALAFDDWQEVRGLHEHNPSRMISRYEIISSAGRVTSVLIVVVIGLVWLVTVLADTPPLILGITILVGLLLLALIAVWQGFRGLLYRRALARVMTSSRRPIGSAAETEASK